ncbi:helix-turn-helix domain-containing GNAT family N-acetyltransferase [Spiractinospora alimapuensis]|uniref:helix-turn-helix domain-containing GNAT family N-acetyltransferase n=1 Tax=Spiractinospora alimapuensis TaxID=2820884 RepID=UPI001F19E6F7|nr:metalloregulator ArsR/SmtB family transcription factor [Spiractinospora alimapuensis]
MTATTPQPTTVTTALAPHDAETYAAWFACLAEPMRVRLLHVVATTPGSISVGELAEVVDVRQPTVSHHLRKLADVGFVTLTKVGTSTHVSINPDCCTGLPHAADAVMGMINARPCCPTDLPTNVTTRPMSETDLGAARGIYEHAIAAGHTPTEMATPQFATLEEIGIPEHRWVAEIDDHIVGWATAAPISTSDTYAGAAETSVYVAEPHRGHGVGKTLLYRQVTEADTAGLWTLQATIAPENRAALALHHKAGFRTVGIRERIAHHHGTLHDTVLLERRPPEGADRPQ